MRPDLRALLLGTAIVLGSGALAMAQPGSGSMDHGHGYHQGGMPHGGMEAPHGGRMMMAPWQADGPRDVRTNQRGYGADPYHGAYPDYFRDPGYEPGYDPWGRQAWQGHPHPHGPGYAPPPPYGGYGSGGWDRPRGFGPGFHHHGQHFHGDYGPPRGGHRYSDRSRRDGDWSNRDRRMGKAMRFHGMSIDTNDDGMISADEAAAHAEMIFVFLDRNGDGVLSRDDWGRGPGARERDARRGAMMDQQAESGEGAEGRPAGQQAGPRGQYHARWLEVFRETDQDGDGRITMEEFMAYHEERFQELAGDEGEVSPWRYRASWHLATNDD